ncbi:MAG: hypothetical protein ACP5XB_17090 [Isosphaeraceae bacterium]
MEPLPFAEGVEVIVQVESVASASPVLVEDLATLPFFGLWADRDDLPESTTWVREQRQQWHQRASRSD